MRTVPVRPTFLVVGVAKAGTTSLHFYLRQHPDVFMPAAKELNFYSDPERVAGRAVPSTLAAYIDRFSAGASARAVGEISPQYINSAAAAARIQADFPGMRIVASIRNPVDRAYSDYLGRVRIARERRSFDEAVRPGERIFEDGFYAEKLRRFFDQFAREQLHVILYDEFAANPVGVFQDLFAFVGVDPSFQVDVARRHNRAELPRSAVINSAMWGAIGAVQRLLPVSRRGTGLLEPILRRTYRPAPRLADDARRRLLEAYQADIAATAALIGRDLGGWMGER